MYLGIDFGTKKIGIATGQKVTQTASPLITLYHKQGEPDWETLASLIQTWQPLALIVGCALHADLSESLTAKRARAFGESLSKKFNLPVYYVDEHLTTYEARKISKESQYQDKGGIDAIAAMLILETWLKGDLLLD